MQKSLNRNSIYFQLVGINLNFPIGYTKALTDYLVEYTEESDVVKAQMADTSHNVLTNTLFHAATDKEKVEDAINYMKNMGISEKAELSKMLIEQMGENEEAKQKLLRMIELITRIM